MLSINSHKYAGSSRIGLSIVYMENSEVNFPGQEKIGRMA